MVHTLSPQYSITVPTIYDNQQDAHLIYIETKYTNITTLVTVVILHDALHGLIMMVGHLSVVLRIIRCNLGEYGDVHRTQYPLLHKNFSTLRSSREGFDSFKLIINAVFNSYPLVTLGTFITALLTCSSSDYLPYLECQDDGHILLTDKDQHGPES